MTDSTENTKKGSNHQIGFWITLIRGILAFALGLSLFFIPEKTAPMLANFMGLFWVTTGLVSLRHDPVIPHRRLARIAAIIIIVTGVAMFTRQISSRWVTWELLVNAVAIIIIVTGVLHIYGGFQIGKQSSVGRTALSVSIGIFEVILGVLFLFSETGRSPVIYLMATIWALVGGTLIIVDAIAKRRQAKRQQADTPSPESSSSESASAEPTPTLSQQD